MSENEIVMEYELPLDAPVPKALGVYLEGEQKPIAVLLLSPKHQPGDIITVVFKLGGG